MPHVTHPTIRGQSAPPGSVPGRSTAQAIADAWRREAGPPARSLYIHIPFCYHKCHYCDFYSIVDTQDRQDAFTDRLIEELGAMAPIAGGLPLRTIFVGGGTPTLLRPDLWQRLARALSERFDLSAIRAGGAGTEFTVECNPETASAALFDVLVDAGVNRMSIGAQSFEPRHLATLERHHKPENVEKTVSLAAGSGIGRTSVDLIYAIPGQTIDEWRADLRTALDLGTRHISAYNLTYEPRTAMTARLERGEFAATDEDTEVAMFELARTLTKRAGLDGYEISNYAAPGQESHHNLAYWRQEPWLAAGPSASGHLVIGDGGHRWKNTPRLDTYLSVSDDGFAPVEDHEPPDPRRALSETIMMGIRLAEGIDAGAIVDRAKRIDAALAERVEGVAARLCSPESGEPALAETRSVDGVRRWRLTEPGLLFADGVAREFILAIGN